MNTQRLFSSTHFYQIAKLTMTLSLFFSHFLYAQTASQEVSFTISNSSLSSKHISFKSYNPVSHKTSGYGYQLNGLSSHAVSLPTPVRVYLIEGNKQVLFAYITEKDAGKAFSVTQQYPVSAEELQQVSNDEANEAKVAAQQQKKNPSVEQLAAEKGLKLITVQIKCSSFFPHKLHVRYQLPWEKSKSQTGFSISMSKYSTSQTLRLPIGTKVYQCSDMFWSNETTFTEKLLLTLNESNGNTTLTL
jgi:hypothetical protein